MLFSSPSTMTGVDQDSENTKKTMKSYILSAGVPTPRPRILDMAIGAPALARPE
jgi:hypothetical protein